MVVTIALESDEAKAAADAAQADEQLLLLVPRHDGEFARVGTVARIESGGDLPGGVRAVVLRGLHRAIVGAGVAGATDALWVEADLVKEPEPTDRTRELAREYRATVASPRRARSRILQVGGPTFPATDDWSCWRR
jgi:ATP-dependent Lon protease